MAKYFSQNLYADDEVPNPPLGPLVGGKVAKATPYAAVLRAQDRVVTQSRRIHGSYGLKGQTTWLVPDTDPDTVSQTHPTATTYRTSCRSKVYLTPGCALRLSVLYSLCGETQIDLGGGDWDPAGAAGSIRAATSWVDVSGNTVTRNYEVSLAGSNLEFGAAPDSDGAGWGDLRVAEIGLIVPETMTLVTNKNQWSKPAVVTVALDELGGCRVVDCVIYEEPYTLAFEADDSSDYWTSHMFGAGNPDDAGPTLLYPFQRLSETGADGDRRGGTWHVQDVANAQALRLGPVLAHWCSFDENSRTVSATEAEAVTTTSATFVGLSNTSQTSYDSTKAGLSLACGGYARRQKYCHSSWIENTGVIPVLVRAYYNAGSSDGTLRVQSSKSSYIDMPLTGSSDGWTNAYGYLEVGKGPGQANVCQLFWRRDSGAGTMSMRDVVIHYAGQHAQPS